jgi:hypothetical protein
MTADRVAGEMADLLDGHAPPARARFSRRPHRSASGNRRFMSMGRVSRQSTRGANMRGNYLFVGLRPE